MEHWQLVDYPSEFANQIKLFNQVCIGGKRYVVPQNEEMQEIGAVVGWGETLEEAMEHCRKAGESVTGYGIKFEMGAADKVGEAIAELEEIGMSPFKMEKKPENK